MQLLRKKVQRLATVLPSAAEREPYFNELCGTDEFADQNGDATVHAVNECAFQEIENHRHALALYFMYYNFARIHQTLRVTPAMQAGITDHV